MSTEQKTGYVGCLTEEQEAALQAYKAKVEEKNVRLV